MGGVDDLELLQDGLDSSCVAGQPADLEAADEDRFVEEARSVVNSDTDEVAGGGGTEDGSRERSVSGSIMDVDDVTGVGVTNNTVDAPGDEYLSSRASTLTDEDDDNAPTVLEPSGRKRRGRVHSDVDDDGEMRRSRPARGAASVGRKRGRLTK